MIKYGIKTIWNKWQIIDYCQKFLNLISQTSWAIIFLPAVIIVITTIHDKTNKDSMLYVGHSKVPIIIPQYYKVIANR